MKDQSKKVANLKHKEQVEKNRNAQLMEEARKREDNISESSQQIKDSLQQKDERIEELEEALRESVQITAEREMVLAQEESARANAEKQMAELLAAMEKVKQELESMKAKLSSTQQSLAEKEAHLTTLRAERRKHLEEVLEMKQEALLAAISEKDANIALLELSSSKKKTTQDEVALLKREKDRLVHQLKQQTQNRMKLIADNYEDDHLKASNSDQTNHKPSPDQIIPPLIDLNQNRSKLKLYISHLTALCHERDPHILQDLAPPSAYHRSQQDAWEEELQKMSPEQVRKADTLFQLMYHFLLYVSIDYGDLSSVAPLAIVFFSGFPLSKGLHFTVSLRIFGILYPYGIHMYGILLILQLHVLHVRHNPLEDTFGLSLMVESVADGGLDELPAFTSPFD
ncbi:ELKS/Rab6-interacting/CAST family member 1-like [Carassius auratus]|uniref:ELKS/Rab6-interacting/CAST family member 1-like n=1 Tax=Carassius auratus TaxID=7957 RepID=A0A6P6N8B6_CARAU|nr:ELKS/Rab6-interacting/CAST family member 1-like [Carassius auratus]